MTHPTPTNQKEEHLSIRANKVYTTLIDQTEFRLSPAQWEAFCQRLDAPPKVIPALRQLFNEPEPYGGI